MLENQWSWQISLGKKKKSLVLSQWIASATSAKATSTLSTMTACRVTGGKSWRISPSGNDFLLTYAMIYSAGCNTWSSKPCFMFTTATWTSRRKICLIVWGICAQIHHCSYVELWSNRMCVYVSSVKIKTFLTGWFAFLHQLPMENWLKLSFPLALTSPVLYQHIYRWCVSFLFLLIWLTQMETFSF